jgi:hypothetical protein
VAFNKLTAKDARESAVDWLACAEPMPMPRMVLFKDEDGLCFHRLPFNLDLDMDTPLFDELMSRASDPMAIKCFIGSLFHENADQQQYMWLFGDGRNGKGTLQRFMEKLMGPAYITKVTPDKRGDKFWTSTLIGKRLVGLPDCDNSEFPTTGLFKMLSGGDSVPIERKSKDGYSIKLNCKFVFSSNEKPQLTSQASDLRRAIYIELEPIGVEPDGEYEDYLWGEASGIVAKCLECYAEEVGVKHGEIPVNSEKLNELVGENEEEWEGVFTDYFDTKPIFDYDQSNGDRPHFTGKEAIKLFQAIYNGQYLKNYKKFIKWLRTEKEIKRQTVRFKKPGASELTDRKGYLGARRTNTWPIRPKEDGNDKDTKTKAGTGDVQI